ncbi:MAG: hypothetical protein ACPG4T_14185 [Nannocystaceae bacterium]
MPRFILGSKLDHRSRLVVACIGFLGHAPGIKLLTTVRFSTAFIRINTVAIALTLIAMGLTYYTTTSGQQLAVAWVIGHFIWSAILACWVLTGDKWRMQESAENFARKSVAQAWTPR